MSVTVAISFMASCRTFERWLHTKSVTENNKYFGNFILVNNSLCHFLE